ncbi:MAG: tRNA threonylcarbamoyladenosine dehydratase [Bacteroidales bacterium]|jgi:tRNA A37 threonylcarbamoyladenosine dehydratase|nr:tRNA threonylcarbamoyladenosine dehydratase [Bacteroidales bacterium]
MDWKDRTRLLLKEDKLSILEQAHVLVVGLGGVGAFAAEMLCRAGIGTFTLVDGDTVEATNRNRQLPALFSTEGKRKVEVLKERFTDINPAVRIHVVDEFLCGEKTAQILDGNKYDYVVDAIDTLSPKIFLILETLKRTLPLVSAMGAGGKLDPSKIQACDISKTYQCSLASIVRKRLRKHGITHGFQAVFSTETVPDNVSREDMTSQFKRTTMGTVSYMPAMFGCWCASVCIDHLMKKGNPSI